MTEKIELKCVHCQKAFLRSVGEINSAQKRQYTGPFCSRICARSSSRTAIHIQCVQCQLPFTRRLAQYRKSKNHFCSQSCAAKYNNTHKTHGTRRSKLEVWIEQKLKELHPTLKIHYNYKDAINSELDIFIPELHLAFELNGIYHYEPIHGDKKLEQIQNNDARKFQACIEHKIDLCIIDTSSLVYFKEDAAVKYLSIITNIIKSKLQL